MSLTFYILLLFLNSCHCGDTNVGTVLFTHADAYKECWSSENLAILTSRMILEDLLPSPSILVIDCNEFVTDLVEYFRMILETVRENTHGKTKHITLVALADLMGGYLQHAVLPIAKYSYYGGLINYQSISSLVTLYEELKAFLRTNGMGWARPMSQTLENFEIPRIPLNNRHESDACQNIILVGHDEESSGSSSDKKKPCNGIIPIPFFDSITKPSAVALPTKTMPLHSLQANTSSFLLMKFFVTAYQCLISKNVNSENMAKFQNDMGEWIENQIMPRLVDETFYPAFGGILRVRLTLTRLGVSHKEFTEQVDVFNQLSQENEKIIEDQPKNTQQQMSKSAMILLAVLITIFLWFILGVSFICYKMRAAKVNKRDECFCPDDANKSTPAPSLVSSKYFYPEKPKAERSNNRKIVIATPPACACAHYNCQFSNSKGPSRHQSQGSHQSHHQIKITTCHCDHSDSCGALEEKEQGRLTSITEMSEQSNATGQRSSSQKRGKKVAIGGSSTADGSSSEMRPHEVNSGQYFETSETEETTTEGP